MFTITIRQWLLLITLIAIMLGILPYTLHYTYDKIAIEKEATILQLFMSDVTGTVVDEWR